MQIVVIPGKRTDHLDQFDQIWKEESKNFMTVLTEQVEADAKLRAPSFRGDFLGAIASAVDVIAQPLQTVGVIFAEAKVRNYAPVIEGVNPEGTQEFDMGRRPGATPPPVKEIMRWVELKELYVNELRKMVAAKERAEERSGRSRARKSVHEVKLATLVRRGGEDLKTQAIKSVAFAIRTSIAKRGLPSNFEGWREKHFRPIGTAARGQMGLAERLLGEELPAAIIARL